MGNSGKFAVITGMVAAGLLILTGMTLAEPVFVAFLGVLALAYVACIVEVLRRRRYVMLAIAGISTSLALAGSLAFLSTWELAFTDQSSLFGTPLPTDDPDNYFFLAALSLLAALTSLFLGAAWPGRQRPIARVAPGRAAPGRAALARASSRSGNGARGEAPARRQGGAGTSQQRTSSAGRAQVRQPTSSARQVPQTQSAARQTPPRQSAAGQSSLRQSAAGQNARQPPRRPAPKK
ncbi:hypothetical protein [Arthrobacter sp. W4I7]|uniref:hypothetical protein n=1 Tax=Arthrobacter sp. W4I7 TaxID=3042296 RepID=UPI0027D80A20|nr:hypothetical protein [Arthrobacter sp. W4I7]